jgi:hypothetical protein
MAAMNVSPPPWAGIVENLQLAGAPLPRQLPGGIQRATDIVAAVDHAAVVRAEMSEGRRS